MIAGDELSDRSIVEMTIRESTERVMELVEWGVDFDKNQDGSFALAKEGGHSEFRVLHHKDMTGAEIEEKLILAAKNHKNIEIIENRIALEIITQHHLGVEVNRRSQDITCYGAYVYNPETKSVDTVLAKITMMATGGLGMVYEHTTNPKVATGDGVAMVYRAKGAVRGMEFVQFHPTSLYNPKESPSFLITEAMRGAGAILKDANGNTFVDKYDERGSLAPRDIVARAIDSEMKRQGVDHVYLDTTLIPKQEIFEHFPNIYAKCLSIGIDITKEMIPVVPVAHYSCGGIQTHATSTPSPPISRAIRAFCIRHFPTRCRRTSCSFLRTRAFRSKSSAADGCFPSATKPRISSMRSNRRCSAKKSR